MSWGVSCQGDIRRRAAGQDPGTSVRPFVLYALGSRARHRGSSPTGGVVPIPARYFLLVTVALDTNKAGTQQPRSLRDELVCRHIPALASRI